MQESNPLENEEKKPLPEPEGPFHPYNHTFSLTENELEKPILDVGAGESDFIRYLRNVIGNKQAYAIDLKPTRPLEEGMIEGDGLNLPFQDETFETVISRNYLPMFVGNEEKMKKAITEMLRVTRQGGRIMGNIFTPEVTLERLQSEQDEKRKIIAQKRYGGSKKLQIFLDDLRKAGLKVDIEGRPYEGYRFMPKEILIIDKT